MNDCLLMIFTRNPVLGKVKTRLAKSVGDQAALNIYIFLLEHTQTITQHLKCDKAVYYSVSVPENDLWNPEIYSRKKQFGNDLGIRMKNAFDQAFKNYGRVIVIGSDMYQITQSHIEEAFHKLDSHDVVIGPAEDGGFYLLGLKRVYAPIFENKDWGTSTVLKDTLNDLKKHRVYLLDTLNDVDIYEDIKDHPAFYPFLQHMN